MGVRKKKRPFIDPQYKNYHKHKTKAKGGSKSPVSA